MFVHWNIKINREKQAQNYIILEFWCMSSFRPLDGAIAEYFLLVVTWRVEQL